jgi:hypothetical protein
MQTPKGYNLVRDSLNHTPESRRLFQSFQRLFIEDIFSSITDKTGQIDFSKARNILKNNNVRQVVENIGGNRLVMRFNQLENFANNLESNINLFKAPATQSLFKRVLENTKSAGLVAGVLHALHMPLPIIAGLGLIKGAGSISKITYNAIRTKLLQNPKALRILENISIANSTEQLAKQLPRLIAEFEKESDSE